MSKSVAIIGSRGYPSFYGGFETLVRELAPFLSRNNWDVTVYGRPGSVRDDLSSLDGSVNSVSSIGIDTKSLSTLSYGLTACLDASWRRPDVALVLNVANGYWLPMLSLREIPTVVNVDGIEWEREKWGGLARSVFKGGARLTARYANTIVCDAEAIGRKWKSDFGRDGVFIPYGGRSPRPTEKPGFLDGRKFILIVARFVPENTVGEFLQAAEVLSEEWDVVIVGSSGYGGELDDRAAILDSRHEHIHWLGHVSDDDLLFGLWTHASVYFHGHSVGGTNPALVQAMACGAPTVARDTVYNREVLGDSAIYCDPTAASIVGAITTLMRDFELQKRFSGEVVDRAHSVYSWDRVCRAYEDVLYNAIAQTHGRKM